MEDGMVNYNISIREVKNLDPIILLNELIFPEDELDVGHNTFHWLARNKHNNEPIGFCSVSDFGEGILFLSRAGLLPEYRGRNIQRRFIRVREKFAMRNGYQKIITYTLKNNYNSISSLIKSDYHIYTPAYEYVGKEFTYFIKDLYR